MLDIIKIGLLVLNEEQTKFLVCEPGENYKNKSVSQYLMPGGKFEEKTVEECLNLEIKEELNCELDFESLEFVGEYSDLAASNDGRVVTITLYSGKLMGQPVASTEIGRLHWIGKDDQLNPRVSPIIRNKILPDLIARNILK